ncbi:MULTISPECIES: hypothetical protein [unclassified Enterococcus]|uniref:hypothetical protein n=1 Tax=unclassified Enterococcus TaxID=2608891 RepID=UPI0013EC7F7A|nr:MULTISPECIES: hypothetical protein [unclassified Enterococcus]
MKNKFLLSALAIGGIGIMGISQTAAASSEGKTTLQVVPLDEEFPRVVFIDNLEFVSRYTDEYDREHFESNDLTITFLDSRKEPQDWELQLKTADFICRKSGQVLKPAYELGKGEFLGTSTEKLSGLTAFEYRKKDAGEEYRTVIRSTGKVERGLVTYTIPSERSMINFPEKTVSGHYYATHSWRLVNADL